jgi:beta-glucanase (GH16 family)
MAKKVTVSKILTSATVQMFLVAGVFFCIGLVVVLSKAAVPGIGLEANSGTLSGNAQSVTDATASKGSAVKFGQSAPSGEYLLFDGFDGTSLRTDLWTAMTRPHRYRNNEEQDYRPSQAKVENGNLVITAFKDATGWHSAELNGKPAFRYAEFEVRMRMDKVGKGTWPAAWLLATTDGWLGGGEIDIMENVNGQNIVHGNLHMGGSVGHWGIGRQYSPVDVTQWHTYKMINTPGHITWWVDGIKRGDYDKSAATAGRNWPFDTHDYYGLLNLAMGGAWPGPTDATTPNPVSLYVDYYSVKKL